MASLVRLGGALRAGSSLFGGVVRRKTGVRNGGGGVHIEPRYREMVEITKPQTLMSDMLMSLMWFWMFWHFWHSPKEVSGHFPYPDPSQWTDEELGIVAEDEE